MNLDIAPLMNILSAQWLWGAIVVGTITYFNQRGNFRLGLREQRRVATMELASQIRVWLIETDKVLADPYNWQPNPDAANGDPFAYYFPTPSDLPAFPFAASMNRISVLRNEDAEKLYRLLERRQLADNEAGIVASVEDNESAAEVFETRIGELFLDGLSVYRGLAKQVGWSSDPVTGQVISRMKDRATKKPSTVQNASVDIPDPPASTSK